MKQVHKAAWSVLEKKKLYVVVSWRDLKKLTSMSWPRVGKVSVTRRTREFEIPGTIIHRISNDIQNLLVRVCLNLVIESSANGMGETFFGVVIK